MHLYVVTETKVKFSNVLYASGKRGLTLKERYSDASVYLVLNTQNPLCFTFTQLGILCHCSFSAECEERDTSLSVISAGERTFNESITEVLRLVTNSLGLEKLLRIMFNLRNYHHWGTL